MNVVKRDKRPTSFPPDLPVTQTTGTIFGESLYTGPIPVTIHDTAPIRSRQVRFDTCCLARGLTIPATCFHPPQPPGRAPASPSSPAARTPRKRSPLRDMAEIHPSCNAPHHD